MSSLNYDSLEVVSLSPKEFQVIVRLAKGYSIERICREINMSESFSALARRRAYKKLNVHSAKELPMRLRQVFITMPTWWINRRSGKKPKK